MLSSHKKSPEQQNTKKPQSPENAADSKDLALLKKNNVILCGSNNAEEMVTSCAGAVQHHLLQRWTRIQLRFVTGLGTRGAAVMCRGREGHMFHFSCHFPRVSFHNYIPANWLHLGVEQGN